MSLTLGDLRKIREIAGHWNLKAEIESGDFVFEGQVYESRLTELRAFLGDLDFWIVEEAETRWVWGKYEMTREEEPFTVRLQMRVRKEK